MPNSVHADPDRCHPAPGPRPLPWSVYLASRSILLGCSILLTMAVFTLVFPETAETPYALGGAACLLVLVLPFGLCVYLAADRRQLLATRVTVKGCLMTVALIAFVVISNLAEMVHEGDSVSGVVLAIFFSLAATLAVFFLFAGLAFRRWRRLLEAANHSSVVDSTNDPQSQGTEA
ncbi:MAG: hypothetical protein JSS02_10460 [Planctomycetes bacterium]|nr:hypothetical protein [Planctomycetota bacterium]